MQLAQFTSVGYPVVLMINTVGLHSVCFHFYLKEMAGGYLRMEFFFLICSIKRDLQSSFSIVERMPKGGLPKIIFGISLGTAD